MAILIASFSTPAGWIEGTGTAVVYYFFDKQAQTCKIKAKEPLDLEKTGRVAEKMLSSLEQRRLNLQLDMSNRVERALNVQIDKIQEDLKGERDLVTILQDTQAELQTRNTDLNTQLGTARNRITSLENFQTTARGQLATAQTQISSLDGNVATLQRQNQDLRTDLASN